MRSFDEFAQERQIKKYLNSNIGALFYGTDSAGRIIVRKFPSRSVASTYIEILNSLKSWVADRQEISGIVDVMLPFEVGTDFVAREHKIYTSTDELFDEGSSIDIAEEFFNQQKIIKNALGVSDGLRNGVVERVIENSLLKPTGKTYFDFSRKKLVMVEPKLLPIDIEMWSQASI